VSERDAALSEALRRGLREARRDERDSLAALLSRAFAADPVYRWLLPDDRRWPRASAILFGEILELFATTGLALTDAAGAGVSLWSPPDAPSRGLPISLRLVLRLGLAVGRLARLGATLAPVAAREPHWYLAVLATAPERQRSGVGTRLLEPVLARCDAARLPAYLETGVAANLAFYGRRGFAVLGETRPRGGGPVIWALRRGVGRDR
jgi:GNAT superfamily N-acetyltransferase